MSALKSIGDIRGIPMLHLDGKTYSQKKNEIISGMQEKIDKLERLLLAIYPLDKTPTYGYSKKKCDKNTFGAQAGVGKRWQTPQEIIYEYFRPDFWERLYVSIGKNPDGTDKE